MRNLHRLVTVAAAAVWLALPSAVYAQPPAAPAAPATPDTFVTWVAGKVTGVIAAMNAQKAIAENGNGTANQRESPSNDAATTSLVDTSAASDFVSLALSLSGLQATDSDDSKPKSGSITVSAYSLAAGIKGVALTDPAYYKSAANWRRLALTIGSEESKVAEVFTDKPSTNLGAKFLIVNNRDVYSAYGQKQLAVMDLAVGQFVEIETGARNQLECIIFRAATNRPVSESDCRTSDTAAFAAFLGTIPFNVANWPATRATLEADAGAMAAADKVIATLAAGKATALDKVAAAVEHIQKARQLAIAYYTKLREADGTDEHRAELIFDYGLSDRLNWTVNGSYDFKDRKTTADSSLGRLATEFQAKLTGPGSQVWSATPVLLAGSAEASKESKADWLIRMQVKVTIPVTTGVNIPVAYTFASRAAEGVVSGSQFKFLLSVDPVRLRERFR